MMPRTLTHGWRFLPALLLLACLGRGEAAPPTPEQLMPAGTTEFVAVSDLARMEQTWLRTQYAQMVNDPALKPFLEHLTPAVKGSNYLVSTIGISWHSVRASCSGELGWGLVPIKDKEVAHILTLDLANRGEQSKILQAEMIKALQARGAKFEAQPRRIGGVDALVVTLPNNNQIVYCIKDGVLIVTDHLPTFQGILARWNGRVNDSLANHKPFQVVKERSQPRHGEPAVARWYFDVIARFQTQLIFDPNLRKRKGHNFIDVLKQQGFDAVKGAGGSVSFSQNGLDVIARGAAYGPRPYFSSMRMAKFENATPLMPERWVPADVNSCVTLNIDLPNAFDAFDTLFERLADEPAGTFKEVMEFLAKDPNGPCVDLRKEIFQQLEDRVTVVNDAVQPVTAQSERFLIGAPIKRPDAEKDVAEALRKCFQPDPLFKPIKIAGHTIWQYHELQRPVKNQPRVKVASIVIGVANGQLYISTHAELLEKVLKHGNQAGMANAADFQYAMKKLADAGAGPSFSRSFVRVGDSARNTYEMLRMNRLDEAESLYAWALNKALKADEKGNKVWFNGALLPHYHRIERYLGNVAIASHAYDDGWSVIAIVLPK